jgi:hypothetical protein
MRKKNIERPTKKTIYMVPYYWEGRVKFLRFNSETYKEALQLAKCCFGERAALFLYKKEFNTKD